jgi:NADPH:quinone reductase-like Zn-dependent oxidoreductase
MKAIVYSAYGSADVLNMIDVEKPTPADNEVLVNIRAASINAPDWRIMSGHPYVMRLMFGVRKPKIRPGTDMAGVVEAVGKNVTQFKPGDAVFGVCRGAFAEYGCTKESRLVAKPDNVTFEQAAAAPICGFTALQGLRDHGHLQPGQRVLVNGASGGVGTFAVQIAKVLGAHVTAVCSTHNVEMVRSLGADRVIDYTQTDFTKETQTYDIIFENAGNHGAKSYQRILTPTGISVMAGVPHNMSMLALMKHMMTAIVLSRLGKQKFLPFIAKSNQPDLSILAEMMATGRLTPAIDRSYPLSETAEAMRYVDTGHARAKVVITV